MKKIGATISDEMYDALARHAWEKGELPISAIVKIALKQYCHRYKIECPVAHEDCAGDDLPF